MTAIPSPSLDRITPEMEKAGTDVICDFDRRFSDIKYLAAEVYEAMERVRRKAPASQPDGALMSEPSKIDPPIHALEAASFAESIAQRHAQRHAESLKSTTDLFVAYVALVSARDRKLAADCLIAVDEALSASATTEKRTEIDVTPAMVAAGVAYFARCTEGRFPDDWLLAESFVTDLYREMNISRSSSLTSQQRYKIEKNRTK